LEKKVVNRDPGAREFKNEHGNRPILEGDDVFRDGEREGEKFKNIRGG